MNISKPLAKIGDIIVVKIEDIIMQQEIEYCLFKEDKWEYSNSFKINKFYNEDIIYNLTTGYERNK